MTEKRKDYFILFFVIFGGVLLRAGYLIAPHIDSDQAVFGLQAMHILKGEYPIFSWGYAYIGTLQSYIDALFFMLFGVSRRVLNSVALLFFVGYALSVYYFAKVVFKEKIMVFLAVFFASFSPEYFLIHGAWARHGYPETYFFGTLMLAMISDYVVKKRNLFFLFILFFIAGLAWWSNFLIVYYFVPLGVFFIYLLRKNFQLKVIIFSAAGFILGSLPFWIYNVKNNFESLQMFEKKIPLFSIKNIFIQFVQYSFPALIGAKKYGSWESIPYIWWIYSVFFGIAIILLIFSSFRDFKRFLLKNKLSPKFIIIVFLISLFGIFFKSNANVGRLNTRYLIPFYSVYPLIVAYSLRFIHYKFKKKYLTFFFVIFIFLINLYSAYLSVPYFNRKAVIKYRNEINGEEVFFNKLRETGKRHFLMYEYWKAALFTFDAKEDLVFAYIKSRYPLYISKMIKNNDFNYLLRKDEKIIENSLKAFNTIYEKKTIAGFKIISGFIKKKGLKKSALNGVVYINDFKSRFLQDKNFSTFEKLLNDRIKIEFNNKICLAGLSFIFSHPVGYLKSIKVKSENELLFSLDDFIPGYCIGGYPFIPKESEICEIYFKNVAKVKNLIIEIKAEKELKLSEILGVLEDKENDGRLHYKNNIKKCTIPAIVSLDNLAIMKKICKETVYKDCVVLKPEKKYLLAPENQYFDFSYGVLIDSGNNNRVYWANEKRVIQVENHDCGLIFVRNVVLKYYSAKISYDYYIMAEKMLKKGKRKEAVILYKKALRYYPCNYYSYKRLLQLSNKNDLENLKKLFDKYFIFGKQKAVFNGNIEFYFDFINKNIKKGGKVKFENVYLFKKNAKNNFYVFVHFIDETGKIRLTADHKIKNDKMDVNVKKFYKGEFIKDIFYVKIPSNLNFKGRLYIWIGLWDPIKEKRFEIKGNGITEESRRLKIGEILIN